jgi:hypothetical protein
MSLLIFPERQPERERRTSLISRLLGAKVLFHRLHCKTASGRGFVYVSKSKKKKLIACSNDGPDK